MLKLATELTSAITLFKLRFSDEETDFEAAMVKERKVVPGPVLA